MLKCAGKLTRLDISSAFALLNSSTHSAVEPYRSIPPAGSINLRDCTWYNFVNFPTPQCRYEEAEGLYKRAAAIIGTALGPDHPKFAEVRSNWVGLLETQARTIVSLTSKACVIW